MSAIQQVLSSIRQGLSGLGYRATSVISDYEFADLLGSGASSRHIPLAAFSDTPPSYRTAAIGVLQVAADPRVEIVKYRDLGAPHWLCITQGKVESWILRDDQRAERTGVHQPEELDSLFERHRLDWTPECVQRAKLIGRDRSNTQLDFAGISLLTSIENRVCSRLDGLVREALEQMCDAGKFGEKQLHVPMQLAFGMIASKVLIDRKHPEAQQWDASSFASVLKGITSYYTLDHLNLPVASYRKQAAQDAWEKFNASVNLRNISAEDLAFVYENTLVTNESRRRFGTHSTPRPVAEYLIDQLHLEAYDLNALKIYEPCCGAAVLLVAAAKKLRALLPKDWSDSKRHNFLVSRLRGSDIDLFAKQVATLSLILADYPNKNGWDIRVHDLFTEDVLTQTTPEKSIVICNPPFEDFNVEQRKKYPSAVARSVHKPISVIKAALERNALACGFVMPNGLISDAMYSEVRCLLAKHFDEIELVSLPDRVFDNSSVESSLLIARRELTAKKNVRVRSVAIRDANREEFLQRGITPVPREEIMHRDKALEGALWLPELAPVWKYLSGQPTLASQVELHRGLEWTSGRQAAAFSLQRKEGFEKGYHNVENSLSQYVAPRAVYLDCRQQFLRTNAYHRDWTSPKVLVNAGRLSRGPWRAAAWIDTDGRVASQQFVGAWLRKDARLSLTSVAALINSPVANAFLFAFNERKGLRLSTLGSLPLPPALDEGLLNNRLETYLALIEKWHRTLMAGDMPDSIKEALVSIDAAILKAYDLPPKLERQLLDLFSGYQRPAMGGSTHYFPAEFKPFISLEEFTGGWGEKTSGTWFQQLFGNVSPAEGRTLARWI